MLRQTSTDERRLCGHRVHTDEVETSPFFDGAAKRRNSHFSTTGG